jgi:hypothetical protein
MASENLGNPHRSRELPGDPRVHFPVHQNKRGKPKRAAPSPRVSGKHRVCLPAARLLPGGGGRSHQGKMLIVGAVEIEDGGAGPGRIRLAEVMWLFRE